MKIFDAHCDLLYKLWENKQLDAYNGPDLQISIKKLLQSNAKVQCFAIFLPETVSLVNRLEAALEQVIIFQDNILRKYPEIKLITSKRDIQLLQDNEIGAILTLEGCEPFGRNLTLLKVFYRLGIRSFGLTWNYANALADGALETRNGGLTEFGKSVVHQLNEYKAWTDVSHLSEQSFWDVMAIAHFPVATHSNVFQICPHPRNLKDEQILALIKNNGMIGVTFVPQFTSQEEKVTQDDVIRHLDYICSLGGENHVGFGSDFDGISITIEGLEGYEKYEQWGDYLLKYYSNSQVEKFLYKNFSNYISF